MSTLVFDIETIPDIASGQKLYNLEGLSDQETAKALFALRRKKQDMPFSRIIYSVLLLSL